MSADYLVEYMKHPFLSLDDDIELKPVITEQAEEEKNYDPVNFPNLRFQCCWARYEVDKLSKSRFKKNHYKKCSLFGFIAVSDSHVSKQQHGWLPLDQSNYGYSLLFHREWHDPFPVKNNHFIRAITNPGTNRSVALVSDVLNIIVDICAFDEEDNQCFKVASSNLVYNLSAPESLDSYFTNTFKGQDGHMDLSFIVLTDAVDAHLEISFKTTHQDSVVCRKPVHVKLIAYYGDDFVSAPARVVQKTRGGRIPITPIENAHYCVTLFEADSVTLVDGKNLELHNCVLAVPAKGSLVVEAYVVDFSSHKSFMDADFKIPAKQEGNNFQCIEGKDCRFQVNVIWKYKADT